VGESRNEDDEATGNRRSHRRLGGIKAGDCSCLRSGVYDTLAALKRTQNDERGMKTKSFSFIPGSAFIVHYPYLLI
jgi:hypothetical protein